MKVIIGSQECGKSTLAFHYIYNEISKILPFETDQTVQQQIDEGKFQVCFITSKKRMMEAQFMFGTYCEVSIETLKQVKLKYIEDYEGLVQYLTDFHLLKNKPSLLAIDGLDYFVENKTLNSLTKAMRLNFLMSLITDCRDFLDQSQVFKANNTIVTYRCSNQDDVDFIRLYNEFSKYTTQIFYLCKNDTTQLITLKLLSNQFGNDAQEVWKSIRFIELFKVDPNPFYFEEDFKYKCGIKRDHSEMVKHENDDKTGDSASGRPMTFKFSKIVKNEGVGDNSITSLFDPILTEIRDYLENLSKAEMNDEE